MSSEIHNPADGGERLSDIAASPQRRACRLLIDEPADGAWNMAMDEALLQAAAEQDQCTLRFYRWAEPTLSLGYFQGYADRSRHSPSRSVPAVRRLSGGGAIVHDRELTYSLAVPGANSLARDTRWLYTAVHTALIEMLATAGIAAELCSPAPAGLAHEPFLCFERRAAGDVILRGAKICGSAQRRWRGALLQHGSLLWTRSAAAPELPGLTDLASPRLEIDVFARSWAQAIGHKLNLDLEKATIEDAQIVAVDRLAEEKYRSANWTGKR